MNPTVRFDPLRRLVALLLVCAGLPAASAAAGADYLEPEQAFRASASAPAGDAIAIRFEIAPGYHLYRDRIGVELESGRATLAAVDLPPGRTEYDENFAKNVEVLRGSAIVGVTTRAADGEIRLRVSYQGCADRGLCYSPQTGVVSATARAGRLERVAWLGDAPLPPAAAPVATPAPLPAAAAAGPGRVESALASGHLVTVVGVFLVAGVLLSMTPCVLPMVPILSSIIVGQAGTPSRLRGFALALAYSLGMALVYTAFGVVAGLLGEGLAAALQNAWVLGAFAALLALLSLSMFGVFELQMPSAVQTFLAARTHRLPGGRFAGVFAMGGLSALVVGPCVAAPLAGALVFIGRTHDVVVGGVALFSLAMGMSVPLLLVGVSAGALLPRAGAWMEAVKRLFGVMLLAVALWIVSPVLPAPVLMLAIGAALIVGAVCLRLFDTPSAARSGRQRLVRGLALLVAVLGTFEIAGALSGGRDPVQPLGHWAGAGRIESPSRQGLAFRSVRTSAELDAVLASATAPVLLDIYADWCTSCKEMEQLTFEDASVRPRLERAQRLRVDVTANSADDRQLLKRFGLFGPPGVLFFRADGSEQREARLVGYVPAAEFATSLSAAGL
jgi:thiol:disulfide interchange protein DsbD